MTLSALGIFSAAGAGVVAAASDYELISTTILGTATSSLSFDVSSFASTYKHLQIRSAFMINATGANATMRFNNESSSIYSRHWVGATGASFDFGGQASQTSLFFGYLPTNSGSNFATGLVCDILDAYSTTKNKTIKTFWGQDYVQLQSGLWQNTSAINTIQIFADNNYLAGSRFSIYGIKG